MKQLPTLYKRTSTGKIQQWAVKVNGDQYWTESGQKGGKLVISTPTLAKAKNVGRSNETTPQQQAQLEAKAKWDLKLRKDYFESLDEVDDVEFKVTLAHSSEKHIDKLIGKWVMVSPKLDGVRCYITKDGAFSRTGKKFVATKYIEQALEPLFKDYPDAILDGELYNHVYKDDFNQIISLCKRMKNFTDEKWEMVKNDLQYHVFDFARIAHLDFEDTAYNRWNKGENLLENNYYEPLDLGIVQLVDQTIIKSFNPESEEFSDYYSKRLEEGYEGVMVKEAESIYEMKRSYRLQKFKKFQTEEFEILDVVEGEGNRTGMMGYLVLKLNDSDETFKANARGGEEFYTELLENKQDYIGKLATHRFMNYTPDGVPRGGAVIAIRDYE